MNIIIYGDETDTNLSEILLNLLTKYGGVQFLNFNKLTCKPKESPFNFFIYDINKLPLEVNIDGVFLFKDSFDGINSNKILGDYIYIIDSQNAKAIDCLKGTDRIVMTYGTDAKSTLTFSSLTADKSLVNLQRYIRTKNKIIEPHEFPVRLTKPYDTNVMLTACAILLFAEVPSADGYEI